MVDLGGTYYNTKPQVEALETLIRKLPDLTTPAHHPSTDRNPAGHGNSMPTRSRNSSPVTRTEQPCTNWGRNSASNGERSATSFTDTTCSCAAAAYPPTKSMTPSTSTTSADPSPESANTSASTTPPCSPHSANTTSRPATPTDDHDPEPTNHRYNPGAALPTMSGPEHTHLPMTGGCGVDSSGGWFDALSEHGVRVPQPVSSQPGEDSAGRSRVAVADLGEDAHNGPVCGLQRVFRRVAGRLSVQNGREMPMARRPSAYHLQRMADWGGLRQGPGRAAEFVGRKPVPAKMGVTKCVCC